MTLLDLCIDHLVDNLSKDPHYVDVDYLPIDIKKKVMLKTINKIANAAFLNKKHPFWEESKMDLSTSCVDVINNIMENTLALPAAIAAYSDKNHPYRSEECTIDTSVWIMINEVYNTLHSCWSCNKPIRPQDSSDSVYYEEIDYVFYKCMQCP